MLQYPNINPVALHISDAIQIRWYGIMYLLAFASAWWLIRARTKQMPGWENQDKLNDLLFYTALGVVLGGRIGYMFFYAFADWLADPWQLFKIWQGGMSFHGGLIGVIIATGLFARCYHYRFWWIADLLAPAIPPGLAFGRMGNFINGELWGKVTDVPWAMVFPHAGPLARHPSQLYAILLEGLLLFSILWVFSRKARKVSSTASLFLIAYGVIRIFEEFFRQPDPQYGYLALGWLTMGQLLCLPMIALGMYLMIKNFCQVRS